MGRRGPPPLPSAMKRSRGTFQPCRNSDAEPRGTPGIPTPPSGLDARERSEWDALGARLAAMGVLQKEQTDALELLVRAKVRYLRLAAKVREMGEVLADAKGDLYRNPHAIAMEKAEVEFRRLLLEFGLTPAAATRVRADVEQAADGDANQRRFFSLVAGKRRKAGAP
jgi:P27 family predicted phage terminase small subunit